MVFMRLTGWITSGAAGLLLLGCSDDGVMGDGTGSDGDTGVTTVGMTVDPDTGVTTVSSADSTGDEGPSTEDTSDGSTTVAVGSSSDGGSSDGGSSDGSSSGGSSSESSSGGNGDGAIGDDCSEDSDCMTGVCWDFADYDPLCAGAVCSAECVEDDDCVTAFTAAGAPTPDGATCGSDGRCDPIGSGFGAFLCAGP